MLQLRRAVYALQSNAILTVKARMSVMAVHCLAPHTTRRLPFNCHQILAAANAITAVLPQSSMIPYSSSNVDVPVTVSGTCTVGQCYLAFTATGNCSDKESVIAPITPSIVYSFPDAGTYIVCYSSDRRSSSRSAST